MVKGNEKGGSWEREAARGLSKWLTRGESASELARSRASGAWKQGGRRQVGDLAPNGPQGEIFRGVFFVECKHTNVNLWDLYNAPRAEWLTWWPKACEESIKSALAPWMMVKVNRRGTYVWLFDSLVVELGIAAPLTINQSPYPKCGVVEWKTIYAMDPDRVIQISRELYIPDEGPFDLSDMTPISS